MKQGMERKQATSSGRHWLIVVASFAVALSIVALVWISFRTKPAKTVRAESPGEERKSTSEERMARERDLAKLTREVRRLRTRLDRQESEARPAASVVMEAAEAPGRASSDTESGFQLSELEVHEHRIASYSVALDGEARDALAATEFENTITEAIGVSGHSSLEKVECRSTLCRLEIRHDGPSGRDRFVDFLFGPLRYGAYDYPVDDGKRTIAFVGMPDHPLPVFDPNDVGDPLASE